MEKTITLTITEDDAMKIRKALCDSAMTLLTKAYETEDEIKMLGRDEEIFEYALFEETHKLIDMIDKELDI